MHILHIHDRLDPAAAAALTRLMITLGPDWQHTVAATTPVTADLQRAIGAAAFADGFPTLSGQPSLTRLRRIASALVGFDLVLTHGYGAIDAAMAHTLFAQTLALPPLVHHESRVDPIRSRRRDWYRRLALGRAAAVIVPTEALCAIALRDWQQPRARVRLVPPGADIAAFARTPRADALPRLIKRKGERWLGVIAGTDANDAPLEALRKLPEAWQLVWFGDGPARDGVRAAATAHNIAHRVHTPGAAGPGTAGLVDLTDALGLLDLIAFSGGDPGPDVVIAAMAAGLAVASLPGDSHDDGVIALLAAENGTVASMTVERLAGDEVFRRRIGSANRAKAKAEFDGRDTVRTQAAIYAHVAMSPPKR